MVVTVPSFAQKENNIWNFGFALRLDFNAGSPSAATQHGFQFRSQNNSASVCNSSGNLLFYSDYRSIFNRNGQAMSNASYAALNGLVKTPFLPTRQNVVIVPFYNDTNKYYVFTLRADTGNISPRYLGNIAHWSSDLAYSVVDMTLNGGLGNIPVGQKALPLTKNLGDKMVAIKGAGCYTWLLVHHVSTNEFLAYKIDATGIAPPVSSVTGSLADFPFLFSQGPINVSPNGKKLVVCNFWSNENINRPQTDSLKASLEVFNFNNATGIVSNPLLIENYDTTIRTNQDIEFTGCAFSANSKVLYASFHKIDSNSVLQWNLGLLPNLPAVISSRTIITTADSVIIPGISNPTPSYYDLRLGPDKKIYVARSARNLERINLPDVVGLGCDYQKYQVSLANTQYDPLLNDLGSTVISSIVTPGTASDTILCAARSIELSAPSFATNYLWQSGSTSATSVFTGPGTTWVQYFDGSCKIVDTFHVAISPLSVSLGQDTVLCNGKSLLLIPKTPSSSPTTYLWQDGSTNSQLLADKAGTYWVQISKDGCKAADTIKVYQASQSISLGPDQTYCTDEIVKLTPKGLMPIPNTSYRWQDGSSLEYYNATASGTYHVQVLQGGCASEATVELLFKPCDCTVYTPTAFTPNGDGQNDFFSPKVICKNLMPSYSLEIFNRWGQSVFRTGDIGKGWDGFYNGKPAEVGTYMYFFTVGDRKFKKSYKGDLLLVR